ncbi:cupin [Mycolicibacterium diernhoferi]|uniref:Cupin n=1 Tax=Mycolicibacterium diernhoferi TaxID=1801 RepID=A0A1T3WIH1_9MYCO|nr:cupin [Mycolicibacterium diernhoferi]
MRNTVHTRAVQPNTVIHAADLALTHEPVPADQSVTGDPSTAATALTEFGGLEIGVWEMSVGTMTDIEADEAFVVLSGAATVEFADGSPSLRLRAGDIGRLAAGAETTWTVTETLRKIYLT